MVKLHRVVICYPAQKQKGSRGEWHIKNEIELGNGHFSNIFNVCKENKCNYVIKLIKNEYHEKIKNEVFIQKSCAEHELCPPVTDWWLCPGSEEYGGVIIMPVLEENLEGYINRSIIGQKKDRHLSWNMMKKIIKLVLNAHQIGVVHRNLKINHFMADKNGRIFLVDMKDAKTIGSEEEKMIYLDYESLASMSLEHEVTSYDILLGLSDKIEDLSLKREISIMEAESDIINSILRMSLNDTVEYSQHTRNIHKEFVGICDMKKHMRSIKGEGYGNLNKFKEWEDNRDWHLFGHDYHCYDWWMFPIDRPSNKQGWKYTVYKSDINELSLDRSYISDYLTGAKLLIKSWGWDIKKGAPYPHPDQGQEWRGWGVRLEKLAVSLKLFHQKSLLDDLKKYAIFLINGGMIFNSIQKEKIIKALDIDDDLDSLDAGL